MNLQWRNWLIQRHDASVTVFLSLVMLVLLSFVTSLVGAIKIHNMKAFVRMSNENAINSTFAEYSVTLRDYFGVFALDGSYLDKDYQDSNILERYRYYGGSEDVDIENIQFLTDAGGAGLNEQIIYYMKNQLGLNVVEGLLGNIEQWEKIELDGGQIEDGIGDLVDLKEQIGSDLEEGVQNPLVDFTGFDLDVIFKLVTQDIELSTSKVNLEKMPSNRELRKGYGSIAIQNFSEPIEKMCITEYVKRVFGMFSLNPEDSTGKDYLRYQVEYVLEGKSNDKDNLKSVIHKLLLMRTPINYVCLQTDAVKQAEAHVLASSLSVASGGIVPEPLIYQSLLFAWSYAESVVEVKGLLEGKKVALIKNKGEWQFDLSGLLSFGKNSIASADQEGGLLYQEYLRMLLFLESNEKMVMRIADIVEHIIREKYEQSNFYIDTCIYRLGLKVHEDVGRGFSYSFPINNIYK